MVDTYLPEHISLPAELGAPAGLFQLNPFSEQVAFAEFAAHFHRREFSSQASFGIRRLLPPAMLAPEGLAVVREVTHAAGRRLLHLEDPGRAAVIIEAQRAQTRVMIASADHETVGGLWREIRARAAAALDSEGFVPCQLWSSTGNGATAQDHEVPAVQWAEVRRNYARQTAQTMDWLVGLKTPTDTRGRLLLWHGPAGTGKTTAATSLMTEWLSWCDTHIVTDPERFFMAPDYLMEVSRRNGQLGMEQSLPRMGAPWPKLWKLIVCEDADEYLRSDARQRSGPALGRLLNLTDGLMGRGSDTIVLLTTNDEVGRLHPAVTRPGRCLAAVEFPSLNSSESAAWCPPGVTPPANGATLAELFALTSGGKTTFESHTTGLYL